RTRSACARSATIVAGTHPCPPILMAAIADSATFRTTGFARDLASRFGLTGFGRWGAQQLAALLPARLRGALEHRRARPVLAFDGSRATLWQPSSSGGRVQMVEVAQIPL